MDWNGIEQVLRTGEHVLLYGPPGTGKSFAARSLGVPNAGVVEVTVTDDTPAAEQRGHFIPAGSEWVFHVGPFIDAWKTGKRLVINEIDHAGGDLTDFLHVVCDDRRWARLTLPTGETVSPQPGFHVVATMNGDPERLPEPIRDRFSIRIEVTELAPGAVQSLPADLQSMAKGTAAPNLGDRRLSIRAWQTFAAVREALPAEVALEAVFGHRAREIGTALELGRAPETPLEPPSRWARVRTSVAQDYTDEDGDIYCQTCEHYHRVDDVDWEATESYEEWRCR